MAQFPASVIKKIAREIAELQNSPPEGIKVIINHDNLTDVQAWIEGPDGTPYQGGCFRVKLNLGTEYPDAPPTGTFLTKIFHPNVSETGSICVNVLKKDWKKEYGLGHILLTIKCLLIDPNPESALNEEAGRLLLEDYNAYAKHARLFTAIHGRKNAQFPTKEKELQENCGRNVSENKIADKEKSQTGSTVEVLTDSNGGLVAPKKRVAAVNKVEAKADKKRTLRRL
ncbi:ubiquitin-conjugating enzyme E2 S-like protein [Gaertneriomyces semiglobifer]|nr:ubiquitin-conjugating enzyme E2 S-like protein [Gaertneriomyces semiglobifer]